MKLSFNKLIIVKILVAVALHAQNAIENSLNKSVNIV